MVIQSSKTSFFTAWAAGAMLLLAAGFLLLGPTGRDDVYMTLWPAQQFAENASIHNYNGDALEQSSSLLHVVVLGGLQKAVGGNIVDLNFGLILACGLLAMGWTVWLGKKLGLPLWPLALTLGGQGIWVYWAMGGLEAVFAALCWVAFLAAWIQGYRKGKWLGLVPAAVALLLVRPENGMVALAAMGLFGLTQLFGWLSDEKDRQKKRQHWLAMAVVLIAGIGLGLWRMAEFGQWFPQPVVAKAGGISVARWLMGAKYFFWQTYRHPELVGLWLGIVAAFVAIIRKKSLNAAQGILLSVALAGLAFVLFAGGDWMENARFIVPYLPILLLLLFSTFAEWPTKLKWIVSWAFVAFSLLGLIQTARFQNTGYADLAHPHQYLSSSDSTFAFAERNNRDHVRDFDPLRILQGETERIYQAKGSKVTILSHQAGFMMYHLAKSQAEQFHFIDLMGLCTKDFTDCPLTKDRGKLNGGLNMDLMYFFRDLPALTKECGIEAPDIVFDLDEQSLLLTHCLKQNGYQIIFLQTGIMPMGTGIFPGLEIDATEFIAVHPRWATSEKTIERHVSNLPPGMVITIF
jgi:hypothetical protein